MKPVRKLMIGLAVAGAMALPGAAHAAPQKDPDCTWTNDNVAVCEFASGGKVCYDHYGHKIACPSSSGRLVLTVANVGG